MGWTNCKFFFFSDTATTGFYTLSLHDALPISFRSAGRAGRVFRRAGLVISSVIPVMDPFPDEKRSEEHTSELQSRRDLVCRLLLEKKKHRRNRHWCPNGTL